MRTVFGLLALAIAIPSYAQNDHARNDHARNGELIIPVGEPVERVAAGSDSSLHYAIYLPRESLGERELPVLFLMDPRGRAMLPLGLFHTVAERYGYVVMSSYDTLSDADSAFAVNARALSAMIVDAQIRFRVDPARMYLVGFSGTAHYAWAAASQLDGHVAGIVGVGGGLPIYTPAVQKALSVRRPFGYYAMAGLADFNYDAVRLLDRSLDTSRVANRFASFVGPHTWMPKDLAESAVEWFELNAMKDGLVARSEGWVDSLCTAYLAEARRLEDADRPADAARRYREVSADCDGLPSAAAARNRHAVLAGSRAVRRVEKRRDDLARDVFDYKHAVRAFADEYRGSVIPHDRAARRLRIKDLREQAASEDRGERANAAQRMLASAFATTAFYEPRDYLESGQYDRAAGMLRLALEIRPRSGFACYSLARAEAQLNHIEEALDALECAVDSGDVSAAELTTDRMLAPLAGTERWRTLVKTVLQKSE